MWLYMQTEGKGAALWCGAAGAEAGRAGATSQQGAGGRHCVWVCLAAVVRLGLARQYWCSGLEAVCGGGGGDGAAVGAVWVSPRPHTRVLLAYIVVCFAFDTTHTVWG